MKKDTIKINEDFNTISLQAGYMLSELGILPKFDDATQRSIAQVSFSGGGEIIFFVDEFDRYLQEGTMTAVSFRNPNIEKYMHVSKNTENDELVATVMDENGRLVPAEASSTVKRMLSIVSGVQAFKH